MVARAPRARGLAGRIARAPRVAVVWWRGRGGRRGVAAERLLGDADRRLLLAERGGSVGPPVAGAVDPRCDRRDRRHGAAYPPRAHRPDAALRERYAGPSGERQLYALHGARPPVRGVERLRHTG